MCGEDYEGAGEGDEETIGNADNICSEGGDVDEPEYNDCEENWKGRDETDNRPSWWGWMGVV